jgi:MFS family permease
VFLFAAVPGALAVLALFAVRETPAAPTAPSAPSVPSARSRIPPVLLAAIALFTLGNSTDALLVLRAQTIGVPTAQLPVLWALLNVVRSLLSWPMGRAADKFGRRRALVAGWLWYAACYAGFALARERWQMWALFAAYGLVAALTEGTGRALGVYNLVSGAGLLAASLLAGQVWDRVSPAAALLLGAGLALAAAGVLGATPRPAGQAGST